MLRDGCTSVGVDCLIWRLTVIVDPMESLSSPVSEVRFVLMVLGNNWMVNPMVLLVFLGTGEG